MPQLLFFNPSLGEHVNSFILENGSLVTDIGDHVSKLVDDGLRGLKNELLDSVHVDIEAEITRYSTLGVSIYFSIISQES